MRFRAQFNHRSSAPCGLALGVLAVAIACAIGRATEPASAEPAWPQWRGPHTRGIVDFGGGPRLPDPWPRGAIEPRWTMPLGSGWSSPVVVEGRVFITDRVGDRERTLAFDAQTGRELWQRAHAIDFDPHAVGRRHGNGPKSTPLVSDGRVYSLGIAGWLECNEAATGREVWKINFPAAYGERVALPGGRAYVDGEECVVVPVGEGQGAPVPLFGYTGSPTMVGDLLITPVGGQRGGTIMAFHKVTGKEAWRALDEHVSYSSPIVATIEGVTQVVVMTGPRVVGLDARNGKLLWSHPFQVQYDESIGTPTIAGNTVVVTGDGHPATALRITRSGEGFQASVAWENDDLSSYLSSLLAVGSVVYGMNDGGEFVCAELATGKTLWAGGKQGYYCTPVLVGQRLLGLNDRGQLLVLAAEPSGYRELGATKLSERATWTSPAVVGSQLYVRSQDALSCFDFGH